jgi:hypothetical protein
MFAAEIRSSSPYQSRRYPDSAIRGTSRLPTGHSLPTLFGRSMRLETQALALPSRPALWSASAMNASQVKPRKSRRSGGRGRRNHQHYNDRKVNGWDGSGN